jgi:uncharacterized membrane protein YebE (DUF533 family)
MTPELLATLVVVPLVEIAWADGHVHDNEKDAILSAADAIGVGKGSIDYDLLERYDASECFFEYCGLLLRDE